MTKQLTDEEIKRDLTPEQYHILREKGTELPFTGKLLNNKATGTYVCPVCETELFASNTKFDSGSGWPSFYEVINKGNVKLQEEGDGSGRTELLCAVCGSHLGHLFNDAPDQPTGLRFCINSASLKFMPKADSKAKKTTKKY
jgi:peptide-methionine (R)-S-oxide reductase